MGSRENDKMVAEIEKAFNLTKEDFTNFAKILTELKSDKIKNFIIQMEQERGI